MTNHVMIDLETVDNVPTAGILTIGACVFHGPQQGRTFYAAIDYGEATVWGLTESRSTLDWWGKQSPEARAAAFDDPMRGDLPGTLRALGGWLRGLDGSSVRVWGNGASFDNAILANAYRKVGEELPWRFWNDRCYRTLCAALCLPERQQSGTHHNALDDAISQAEHLMADPRARTMLGADS